MKTMHCHKVLERGHTLQRSRRQLKITETTETRGRSRTTGLTFDFGQRRRVYLELNSTGHTLNLLHI